MLRRQCTRAAVVVPCCQVLDVSVLRKRKLDRIRTRRLKRRSPVVVSPPLRMLLLLLLLRMRHRPAAVDVDERNDSSAGGSDKRCRNHLTVWQHHVQSSEGVVLTPVQGRHLLLVAPIEVWRFEGVVDVLLRRLLADSLVHVLTFVVAHRIGYQLHVRARRGRTSDGSGQS